MGEGEHPVFGADCKDSDGLMDPADVAVPPSIRGDARFRTPECSLQEAQRPPSMTSEVSCRHVQAIDDRW